jgi:hypothetical protein
MLDKCDLFCWKNWKQQTIGGELLDVLHDDVEIGSASEMDLLWLPRPP